MLKLLLLRHGMTPGNQLSRYIGSTDEPLSQEGKQELRKKTGEILSFGTPERIFISPMKRCVETAEILFPGQEKMEIEELKEFDFGIFENKNYQELKENAHYQVWLDSFCEAPVPQGECLKDFKERSCIGFRKAISLCLREKRTYAVFVVHGGTIMSLMERYARVKKSYYDWHVKNGEGFLVELDPTKWETKDFSINPVFFMKDDCADR